MIQSMTGYGKADAQLKSGKLTLEVRTLNSKSADINIKSSLLPKEKELEVRKRLADRLVRGTIDLYLTYEAGAQDSAHTINAEVFHSYWKSAVKALDEETVFTKTFLKDPGVGSILANAVLRLPDVVEARKGDVVTAEDWPAVSAALDSALDQLCSYRSTEGEALYKDVTSRVALIGRLYDQVEALEGERISAVREKLQKALEELGAKPNPERFEQELIFYLEKYDINEEKVRLRQHCKYFMEVIDSEPYPGKKLGFILQEMGREINTTGSKANHAGIQQLVVRMKDELEKIREQSMNIL
ncbi:MAG: YicC family protein [Bacteroidales bacterium]|nr:YicC family protein [Bacteroidales bacterium]MBQ9702242.1 YicC family protein [Bacteroidales bacterium]MBR1783090.1 YicC family protein [Bacteroidales bacterium]